MMKIGRRSRPPVHLFFGEYARDMCLCRPPPPARVDVRGDARTFGVRLRENIVCTDMVHTGGREYDSVFLGKKRNCLGGVLAVMLGPVFWAQAGASDGICTYSAWCEVLLGGASLNSLDYSFIHSFLSF